MTKWEKIHPDFTDELQKEWEDFGFVYEQVEEWISCHGFSPHDAEFAMYIGDNDEEEEAISDMKKEKLDKLREEYNKEIKGVKIDPSDWSWRNIHPNFTPELVKRWQECGFSYEQTQDWINAGFRFEDAEFCAWLRDIKKVNTEWVLNHGNIEQLKSEYQQYLLINQQIQVQSKPF